MLGRRSVSAGLLSSLTALLVLAWLDAGRGDEPAPPPRETERALPPDHPTGKPPVFNLLACRQLALERSPYLTAYRARLGAAALRQQAVNKLGLAALVARDLPLRRQQAAVGVGISSAALQQAEQDVIHSVTYTYVSVVYARKQQAVANDALRRLKTLRDMTKKKHEKAKEAGDDAKAEDDLRDFNAVKFQMLTVEGRREEAQVGEHRALSALREALAFEGCQPLFLDCTPFELCKPPCMEEVVALALSRRGDVAQAAGAAHVSCLEVAAQKRACGCLASTFAASSDIHARPIPTGRHDEVYRPDVLAPEMPVILPGWRADRVKQAEAYHTRSQALLDKTRSLITLEAEQAYLHWKEADRRLAKYAGAKEAADSLVKRRRKKFEEGIDKLDDLLAEGQSAADAEILVNEMEYKRQLALAEIERVTAGAFCPGWQQLPPPIE
jgi:outer membrane protein TolC